MRLLLVEDDAAAGRPAAGYPHGQPATRSTAPTDGEDALFLGRSQDYDLVVLDLGLPRLPGLAVLERWRAEGRAMPVLILTARDTWREKVEGLKAGADDYLTKPFHPEELLARLQALLAAGSRPSGAGASPPGTSVSTRSMQRVVLRGRHPSSS